MSTTMWDVIVIGAGIEGSATAYSLAKRGRRVLQLEQFVLPHGRGSSHGQSRITRLAYTERHYTRMMVDAFDMWDRLEKDTSTQLYIPTGLLTLGDAKSSALSDVEKSLTSIGAKFERLSGSKLTEQFPMMHFDDSTSAVLDPSGGILRADKCLAAYQSEFRKYRGVLQDGEPVLRISPVDQNHAVVKTSKSSYKTHSVVITAGPWTSRLTEPLGLMLPLQPTRISVWFWKQTNDNAYGNIEHGSPTFIKHYGGGEVFGLPSLEYPGHVKVCYHGGQMCDPDRRDEHGAASSDQHALKLATSFVQQHLPGVEVRPSVTEACIYTLTPDNGLILDCHPQWKNIVVGAGFSGHGFKLAPVVGEILADLATTGHHKKHEMHHFRIDRFASLGQIASKL